MQLFGLNKLLLQLLPRTDQIQKKPLQFHFNPVWDSATLLLLGLQSLWLWINTHTLGFLGSTQWNMFSLLLLARRLEFDTELLLWHVGCKCLSSEGGKLEERSLNY
jgi:hypothetical protein